MRTALLIGILLGCTADLRAQQLGFRTITKEHGLSDNAITCLHQGADGQLWVGTESGLDRFDGQRVQHIHGTAYTLTGITQDRNGTTWATTKEGGILCVSAGSNHAQLIEHIGPHGALSSEQLNAVFDLNDTTLLIASTESTLLFFDKRTRAFSHWVDSLDLSPARAAPDPQGRSGWAHSIIALNDDLLWVGLLNLHLSLLVDRHTLKVSHHLVIHREGSSTSSCATISGDRLFVGGWQNGIDVVDLSLLDPSTTQHVAAERTITTDDEVLHLTQWSDRSVAGTRGRGLLLFDPATGRTTDHLRHTSEPGSLPSDRIRSVLVDREGRLWVGTANGLALHAPALWQMSEERLQHRDGSPVDELLFHNIMSDADGTVRAFTSEGFYLLPPNRGPEQVPVMYNGSEMQPTTLFTARNTPALLGTEHGLFRSMDGGRNFSDPFPLTDEDGRIQPYGNMFQVRSIHLDTVAGEPMLLVGVLGYGLNTIALRTGRTIGTAATAEAMTSKARALVHDVERTSDGTYWVATADGIYRWTTQLPLMKMDRRPSATTSTKMLALGTDVRELVLRHDTCWAITRQGRLFRFTDSTSHTFIPGGDPVRMHGACSDLRGKLWITTDDGLLRFDPADTSFTRLPVGMGPRKLSGAITCLPNGEIAFGTTNSIVRFLPEAYDTLPPLATPYIAALSSAGKEIVPHDGRIVLAYTSSVIDLELSALSFDLPAPLRFEYRLDGVESERRSSYATELIRYAGIPTGQHVLYARTRDCYGRIGPEVALLTVHVEGPFWQQWWFYAITALIVSIGAYAWSRYRVAQALKLQAVRNRIASDLHDEVGSSLSSITIGSKLAAQLSTSESAQVKEILARIGETSSESLRSISDIVWAIDPKNDQGEALVKRMRRIANELLESKGIEVRFEVSGGVEALKLPMNARKEIVLIYKEAVHNASKYSAASLVDVTLKLQQGTLTLRVQDNGRGFDPALHPDGHGLGSMKRRAEALHAAFALHSTPEAGTTIELTVDTAGIRD